MLGLSLRRSLREPEKPTWSTNRQSFRSRSSCRRTPNRRSGMGFGANAQNRERLVLSSSVRRVAVHQSSSSIGELAAALAKAQAALVNPEKSLVGSIQLGGPAGAERVFRYAPLSAGLDIVRKTLGEHEIAVV